MHQEPATIVREARHRAGLSQRALAQRAGTTQSVVARIELGQTRPTWETVVRLVEAAGLALDTRLLPRAVSGSHMLQDVARIRALSPEARLAEVVNLSRFVAAARRA